MQIEDFSNGFDLLLNSYATPFMFGEESTSSTRPTITLDEYEKSFFLTKAQEDLALELYNGKNAYGEAFENTEEQRRYLSNLVMEEELEPISGTSGVPLGVDSKSKFFTLPEDLWFITYEAAKATGVGRCNRTQYMDVYPVTQDEYHKIKRNPFRGANGRRALRLDLADNVIEIVCKYQVISYYVRYLKKLKPIILVDLPDNLNINGISYQSECMLHESLHQKILERAVMLALQSKGLIRTNNNKNENK